MEKMGDIFALPLKRQENKTMDSFGQYISDYPDSVCAEYAMLAINHVDALAEALEELFDDYKQLSDSGDAGNLSIEKSSVGMKAKAALAAYRGEA